jgi:hypothetical protein
MRIKIATASLLEKIKAHKAQLEAQHEAEMRVYDESVKVWRKQAKVALQNAISLIAAGNPGDDDQWRWSDRYSDDNQSEVVVVVPLRRPSQPDDIDYRVERDLEAVRACMDQTISIGPDDHLYRYLADPDRTTRRRR